MRKLSKLAVVAAMVGSVGVLGAGTAFADAPQGGPMGGGPDISVDQKFNCKSHDLNLNVLGNLSLLNGLGGGLLNGEGDNGETNQHVGSEMACGANAFTG
jgi:hypothetical protein